MAEITLIADTGRPTGSPAARRLRAADHVPAVVYGKGVEPTSITVERRALRQVLSGEAGLNAVINLQVSGRSHPTVVKELQRHPVRRSVTHVDFLVVDLDVELEVEVPIELVGEAKAVLAGARARRPGAQQPHRALYASSHPQCDRDRHQRDAPRRRDPRFRPHASRGCDVPARSRHGRGDGGRHACRGRREAGRRGAHRG